MAPHQAALVNQPTPQYANSVRVLAWASVSGIISLSGHWAVGITQSAAGEAELQTTSPVHHSTEAAVQSAAPGQWVTPRPHRRRHGQGRGHIHRSPDRAAGAVKPGPHRIRQRCSGPVCDPPSASRPGPSCQNRLQSCWRRVCRHGTGRDGTRSDGRKQGRNSADGCGEDRA